MQNLSKFMQETECDPEKVKKQSLMAYYLWKWVAAVITIHQIYLTGKITGKKRQEAEVQYHNTMSRIKETHADLDSETQNYSSLRAVFIEASHVVEASKLVIDDLEVVI